MNQRARAPWLAVAGLLPFLAGCNTAMMGQRAPELAGDAWILPDGGTPPGPRPGNWTLLAFFGPT